MNSVVSVSPVGALLALLITASIAATLYWMLHPPKTIADIRAKEAVQTMRRRLGTLIVVFSEEIRSEHMMVLASRLARGLNSDILAVYVVEVPFMLPSSAEMEEEDRTALDTLASAEVIAKNNGIDVRTEIVHQRQTASAVLEIARREKADLIVMGSYREGKYTGAPLGRVIESIAAEAKCDVIIGVEGKHGTLLGDESDLALQAAVAKRKRWVPPYAKRR